MQKLSNNYDDDDDYYYYYYYFLWLCSPARAVATSFYEVV
jgi:hypothetical protein